MIVWLMLIAISMLLIARCAGAVEICSGGHRAERKVTCVVDGDTIWQRGLKMRLLDIDAPETFGAECPREKALGEKAKLRLQELMGGGYRIANSGLSDRTTDHRALVRVFIRNGRDAGQELVKEGLAQPWPNKGNKWCGR
ncbi:thermonuclease family protein [Rhizobium rhizosphaerae]|nr:thermonuclease family protein [Xaviernesmea rhizosphaerae]